MTGRRGSTTPRQTDDGVRPLDWARAVTRHPFPMKGSKTVKGKADVLAVALTLVTLAPGRRHDRTGWTFFAGGPTLQGLTGLGESSVGLVLRQLRAAGFLALVTRGGGRDGAANTWRLTFPDAGTPVPQSTEDRPGTPVPQGTEDRDGTPVLEGSISRALGHGPREVSPRESSTQVVAQRPVGARDVPADWLGSSATNNEPDEPGDLDEPPGEDVPPDPEDDAVGRRQAMPALDVSSIGDVLAWPSVDDLEAERARQAAALQALIRAEGVQDADAR